MVTPGPLLEIYERPTATKVASLATAGFLGFLVGVAVLHALRSDYNPLREMLSDYVNGPYGYLLTAAFTAQAVGCMALLVGLRRALSSSRALAAGLVFLAMAAFAFIGAALFPTDPLGAPITRTGVIHTFAFLISFTSMLLAVLLLSAAFRKHEHWNAYYRKAMLLALFYAAAYALLLYCLFTGSPFAGLADRVAVCSMLAWLLGASLRLRTTPGPHSMTPA